MSEISKIYAQFEKTLRTSRDEYDRSSKEWAKILRELYEKLLRDFTHCFGDEFRSQLGRMRAKGTATSFFGQEEIPFVAIDGSCYKKEHQGFISFYGGAYGSKGKITFEADTAKLRYQRWEFSKDVSMVAFIPLPPDQLEVSVERSEEGRDVYYTDAEVRELSGLHTKVMQLAEVYLAYSVVRGIECPRIVLMDTTLSGLLGNTSYSPDRVSLVEGSFEGERLSKFDLNVALAHPFSAELDMPSPKDFHPWYRIFFAAHGKGSTEALREDSMLSPKAFKHAGGWLKERGLAKSASGEKIELVKDPRSAWRSCLNVFEAICYRLFKAKDPDAIRYKDSRGNLRYLSSADIRFLTGVGFRRLIELCWERKVLLVGVVKDSSSRYFYRNFLGSAAATGKLQALDYRSDLPLTDRRIMETLSYVLPEVTAPWSTIEFDSAFMTLHPEPDPNDPSRLTVQGYDIAGVGRVTRPERIFLRSVSQFLLSAERGLSSHALFIDRLAYPGWDDKESEGWLIDAGRIGKISPLFFSADSKVSSLQYMSQFLLSVLVRNHFPEALGYPDPLHKADWGAKSMERRVKDLIESADIPFKARPLERSMREIRDSFGR